MTNVNPNHPSIADKQISFIVIPASLDESTRIGMCKMAELGDTLRSIVHGFIELVSLKLGDMFINEEGKLYDLPPNPRATHLAWHDKRISHDDYIVGDVIICGKSNQVGEQTGLTPELRTHIIKVLGGHA